LFFLRFAYIQRPFESYRGHLVWEQFRTLAKDTYWDSDIVGNTRTWTYSVRCLLT
jgi:hypothetical protein